MEQDQIIVEKEREEEIAETNTSRRDMLRSAVLTAAGLVAGGAVVALTAEPAAAQERLRAGQNLKADVGNAAALAENKQLIAKGVLSLNAKAVLGDGSVLDRKGVLAKLNLNPGAAPEAWLNITKCGVNASALNIRDARVLVDKGMLDKAILSELRQ